MVEKLRGFFESVAFWMFILVALIECYNAIASSLIQFQGASVTPAKVYAPSQLFMFLWFLYAVFYFYITGKENLGPSPLDLQDYMFLLVLIGSAIFSLLAGVESLLGRYIVWIPYIQILFVFWGVIAITTSKE